MIGKRRNTFIPLDPKQASDTTASAAPWASLGLLYTQQILAFVLYRGISLISYTFYSWIHMHTDYIITMGDHGIIVLSNVFWADSFTSCIRVLSLATSLLLPLSLSLSFSRFVVLAACTPYSPIAAAGHISTAFLPSPSIDTRLCTVVGSI